MSAKTKYASVVYLVMFARTITYAVLLVYFKFRNTQQN